MSSIIEQILSDPPYTTYNYASAGPHWSVYKTSESLIFKDFNYGEFIVTYPLSELQNENRQWINQDISLATTEEDKKHRERLELKPIKHNKCKICNH